MKLVNIETVEEHAVELLAELIKAHKIIANALNCGLTDDQRDKWDELNTRDGVKDGFAVTREQARRELIAKVSGESSDHTR